MEDQIQKSQKQFDDQVSKLDDMKELNDNQIVEIEQLKNSRDTYKRELDEAREKVKQLETRLGVMEKLAPELVETTTNSIGTSASSGAPPMAPPPPPNAPPPPPPGESFTNRIRSRTQPMTTNKDSLEDESTQTLLDAIRNPNMKLKSVAPSKPQQIKVNDQNVLEQLAKALIERRRKMEEEQQQTTKETEEDEWA